MYDRRISGPRFVVWDCSQTFLVLHRISGGIEGKKLQIRDKEKSSVQYDRVAEMSIALVGCEEEVMSTRPC